jgi:hypothetical protein
MGLDGLDTEVQRRRDLGVGQAARRQAKHLLLALGEPPDPVVCRVVP